MLRSESGFCRVVTDDGKQLLVKQGTKVRGHSRQATTSIVIGDRVRVRLEANDSLSVTAVLPRRNELFRLAPGRRTLKDVLAANLDHLFVVEALHEPELNPARLDRFLAIAEQAEVDATVVLNKDDLATAAEAEETARLYGAVGYEVIVASAKTGDHIREIAARLEGICALIGPSGAGKSTLLNRITPRLTLRTGEISQATGKGRHTTVAPELLDLGHGNFVADTPGLRGIAFTDIDRYEVAWLFREMRPFVGECRFPDCLHQKEPGCAVLAKVEAGRISPQRWRSYIRIMEDVAAGFVQDWEV